MNGSGRSTEYETIGVGHNLSATTRYYPARQFDPVSNAGVYIETQAELVFKLLCSGTVTNTIEHAAVKDYKTTPAAGEWTDITSQFRDMAGASAASYVDATKVLRGVVPPGRVRVKSVTADATNDVLILMAIKPCDSSGVVPSGAATEATVATLATQATLAAVLAAITGGLTGTFTRIPDSPSTQSAVAVPASPAVPTVFGAKALTNGIVITAPLTNASVIYLVDATVATAALAAANGTPIYPGQSVWREGNNANQYACSGPAGTVNELRLEAA